MDKSWHRSPEPDERAILCWLLWCPWRRVYEGVQPAELLGKWRDEHVRRTHPPPVLENEVAWLTGEIHAFRHVPKSAQVQAWEHRLENVQRLLGEQR